MGLKLVFRNDEEHDEFYGRIVQRIEFDPAGGAPEGGDDFIHAIRGGVGNGDSKADSRAHRFLALPKHRQHDIAIRGLDLILRHQQFHEFDNG